jgi:hypothetical protein
MAGSLNQPLQFRPIHLMVENAFNGIMDELEGDRRKADHLYRSDYIALLDVLGQMKKKKIGLEYLTVSLQGWEIDEDILENPPKVKKNGHSTEPIPAEVG